MAAVSRASEGRKVKVRLSQVPVEIRRQVADQIIEKGELGSAEALELTLRALIPRQDPTIRVPEHKARSVLERGRVPAGKWDWR